MPEKINPKPGKGEKLETNEKIDSNDSEERFESDSQKIVRRHMEDENDIITEDDIRNVRVGMESSTMDAATEARFVDEETREKIEEKYIGKKEKKDKEDKNLDDQQITPWDTLDPTK